MGVNELSRMIVGAMIASVAFAGGARAASWTPWQTAFAPYPNPVTAPGAIEPNPDAQLMWYCLNAANCTTGTEGPYQAEFRLQFNLTSLSGQYAPLLIAADDYFALYLNGIRVPDSGQWLDNNRLPNGQPHASYFNLAFNNLQLGSNELLVYACDGYPPDPLLLAGVSADNANMGCPNPGPRGYHYVFVDGFISTVQDSVDMISGGDWQARTEMPEPPALATLGVGLLGLAGLICTSSRGGRDRRLQRRPVNQR